jgi:hypothetical protein
MLAQLSTPSRWRTTSRRTTKLYDRTNDAISLDEIERILISVGHTESAVFVSATDALSVRVRASRPICLDSVETLLT